MPPPTAQQPRLPRFRGMVRARRPVCNGVLCTTPIGTKGLHADETHQPVRWKRPATHRQDAGVTPRSIPHGLPGVLAWATVAVRTAFADAGLALAPPGLATAGCPFAV